jgi:hypothetical protein
METRQVRAALPLMRTTVRNDARGMGICYGWDGFARCAPPSLSDPLKIACRSLDGYPGAGSGSLSSMSSS